MKNEEWEKISYEEFRKLPNSQTAYFQIAGGTDVEYFKKAQKFPIVFEDDFYEIKLGKEYVRIIFKKSGENFYFHTNHSLSLLVKAVERLKEIMKKE